MTDAGWSAGSTQRGGGARVFDFPSPAARPLSRWRWAHAVHAVLLPLVALGLQLRLARYLHQFPVILFFPAVFISAWLGGLRWAMVAGGISIALAGYYLVPSEFAFVLQDPGTLLAKAVVVALGVMLTIIYGRLKAATQRANDAHDELRRRSETRFRALIEHSTDGIVLIDVQHTIRHLSPAVTVVEGYARQELLGHSCFEHIHPEDLERMQGLFEQILADPERSVRGCGGAATKTAGGSGWRGSSPICSMNQPCKPLSSITVTSQHAVRANSSPHNWRRLSLPRTTQSSAWTCGVL